MIIIGVDTGGTFTDFVYRKNGRWGIYKCLSTPENPANAVIQGIQHISEDDSVEVIHGSTVATNALLERKGAKTALITNAGFENIIQIGRQNREALYDLFYQKPKELISSERCYSVNGRIDFQGEEILPFDAQFAETILQELKAASIESVAISFLFSYLNPQHEMQMADILSELDISISTSNEMLGEFREYERMSTTVINAYVQPKMVRYLNCLKKFIGKNTLRVMQSNGGSISVESAMHTPARTILSGPAGGAIGALEIGATAGYNRLITFDMGGTSTDVCLIEDELPISIDASISGFPLKVPMLDIHTVGAGGGSIAALDAGGALAVGPESAGADPGPICYGKGSQITVTDANLFLGRLIPEHFLGGNMHLHYDKIQRAFKKMADDVKLNPYALAEGILDVANANMERAIRVISVEKGFDPREFSLFSFGGAGGLHCAMLARQLSVSRVIVPKNPGILSAFGMVMADVIKDYSQTVMLSGMGLSFSTLQEKFLSLEQQAVAEMKQEGFSGLALRLEYFLDIRYQGQSFELIVPFGKDYEEKFSEQHEQTYGYQNLGKAIEVVNIRLRAYGSPEKPAFAAPEEMTEKIPACAKLQERTVYFDGRKYQTPVYDREKLLPGNLFSGPAIFVEYSSTIVLPLFASAKIDAFENLIMEINF